jgi:prolyl 4-hydroxylase
LLLLAGDAGLIAQVSAAPDAAPHAWRRLADSFDLTAWTTAADRRPICEKPRIRIVEDFISPGICAWLVDRARGRLHPGLMYNGREAVVMETRDCSEFIFDIVGSDLVGLLVRVKIAATTKLPIVHMEPTQIFHYGPGQQIKAHYDLVRDTTGGGRGASESVSERIATFLIYLNDDYDGGELHFTLADVKFRGRAGDAIYFANVDEAGKAERLSLHLAMPITRGEKWMSSQWIQDRPTYSG